jgi:hypothetical protein
MGRWLGRVALAALALGACAQPAFAQAYAGRIDVIAADATGAPLVGVLFEVSGGISTLSNMTDVRGEAHFLSLPPGKYAVKGHIAGFADYKNDDVPVGAGSTVTLRVAMKVGAVTTNVDVSAAAELVVSSIAKALTPMIEVKKTNIATNVTSDELQNVPSARDPWVVLQTVPGVVVDRVNVGGTESGHQSVYQAKGASSGENTLNMDGIALTDMAGLGASRARGVSSALHGESTYYDFDMFQEMQVTTGGGDPSVQTAGVQLNFVLKSGTNMWRLHARDYFANHSTQGENLTHQVLGSLQSYDRVNRLTDVGVEGGGPLVKGRLFVWGAYGRANPRTEVFSYQPVAATLPVLTVDCKNTGTTALSTERTYAITARDCAKQDNYSTKITGDLNVATRATFAYFRGEKRTLGRDAGATRPDETTWNQSGPMQLSKGELSRTFRSDLFMAFRVSHIANRFSLDPRGLAIGKQAYSDDAGVWHNNYAQYRTNRPQNSAGLDGNFFRGSHDLKFGFGWRKASVSSSVFWPTGGFTVSQGYPTLLATVARDWAISGSGSYLSGYLGDRINLDRLTLNAGLRWDRSAGSVGAASVGADPLAPTVLPAATAAPASHVIVWNSITPRVGLTYALTESRKTLTRVSYAMFASQLDSNRAAIVASGIPYAYAYYAATDANGDHVAQPSEYTKLLGTTVSGGATIGKYGVPKTHEMVVEFDHEPFRNVGLTVVYTWRRFTSFNWQHYTGITGASYVAAPLSPLSATLAPIGPYNAPFYVLNTALPPTQIFETRPGYHQTYNGLEASITKRMSNRWTARTGFTINDHLEYFAGPSAMLDRTPTPTSPNRNGGIVVMEASGSGRSSTYLVLPKLQYVLLAQYRGNHGINVALNYSFRQGYAEPYFRSNTPGSADALAPSGKNVLVVSDVGAYRLANLNSVDLRISKNFKLRKSTVDFDLDVFNLFNLSTVLAKQYDISRTTFNLPQEVMNPRVIRLGVRIGLQ